MIRGIVYVGGGGTTSFDDGYLIQQYSPTDDRWYTLPPAPVYYFGMGELNGQLVIVGGRTRQGDVTGKVHTLNNSAQKWVESIAPMPTARSRNRPIASFMFLGPTGVGKTELCKTLANFLFNTEEAMIRIDMSEYMEKHSVSRLIGAPPGYVGFEEGGQLTEAVRRRPYSVVLFDEMEKAHGDVFNVLLQILDDGRVTDSQGRLINFKNTILIMTSNIGSQFVLDTSEEGGTKEARRERVMEAVRGHFRPEFINRVDEWIVFDPLAKDQVTAIVEQQIKRVGERLADRKIRLRTSAAAVALLSDTGYDPAFGARPVKRAVQSLLETAVAQAILRGDVNEDQTAVVDVSADVPGKLSVVAEGVPSAGTTDVVV